MTQVLADPVKDDRRQLNLTDERVAAPTEEPAHTTSVVTVVHHEIAARGIAEQASTSLGLRHRLNLLGREVVLPHQAGAQVLGPRSLGVRPTPLTEALIPTSLVGLPVPTAAFVRARLAVGPQVLARLREGLKRQVLTTVCASLHAISMAYQHGNVWRLDQPCHADVLLELANRETP